MDPQIMQVLIVIQVIVLIIAVGVMLVISTKLTTFDRTLKVKDEEWLYGLMKEACTKSIEEYDPPADPPQPQSEELEIVVEQTRKKKK